MTSQKGQDKKGRKTPPHRQSLWKQSLWKQSSVILIKLSEALLHVSLYPPLLPDSFLNVYFSKILEFSGGSAPKRQKCWSMSNISTVWPHKSQNLESPMKNPVYGWISRYSLWPIIWIPNSSEYRIWAKNQIFDLTEYRIFEYRIWFQICIFEFIRYPLS